MSHISTLKILCFPLIMQVARHNNACVNSHEPRQVAGGSWTYMLKVCKSVLFSITTDFVIMSTKKYIGHNITGYNFCSLRVFLAQNVIGTVIEV